MIKFMHTSDLLLDQKITNNNFSLRERQKKRMELIERFRRLLKIAAEEKIQYLFIAGNLFDNNYISYGNLLQLTTEFSRLKNTKIIISDGSANLNNRNLIKSVRWPSNVYLQNEISEITKLTFDDGINIYLCGGVESEKLRENLYNIDTREDNISVLLSSCNVDNCCKEPFKLDSKLIRYKFDYCALGGSSEYLKIDTNIYYPGKIAQIDFEETNTKCGYILGELTPNVKVDYIALNENRYVNTEISIDADDSMLNIIDKIRKTSNSKEYVRIRLSGQMNSDISFDEIKNEAKQFFNYVEFDEKFKIKAKNSENEGKFMGNIIESYIDLFDKMDMNDVKNEKAFELGINLLKAEEVEN